MFNYEYKSFDIHRDSSWNNALSLNRVCVPSLIARVEGLFSSEEVASLFVVYVSFGNSSGRFQLNFSNLGRFAFLLNSASGFDQLHPFEIMLVLQFVFSLFLFPSGLVRVESILVHIFISGWYIVSRWLVVPERIHLCWLCCKNCCSSIINLTRFNLRATRG